MKAKSISLKISILMVIPVLLVGIYNYQASQRKYFQDVEARLQSEAKNWQLLVSTVAKISNNKEPIKQLISQEVIGKTGYTWVVNSDGVYQVSKNRLRDGEDINDSKDTNGVLFIQEAVKKAKANPSGGEFQAYPWQNQGEFKPRMKVAGLSYVPEWDWIIGSSAYYDDFETNALGLKDIFIVSIITVISGLVIVPPLLKKRR